MASIRSSCFLLLASTLLLSLLITPSSARLSVKVTSDEIKDICSKSTNPSFCQTFLTSTPGVSTADYPGLAKITVDLARSNATNTLNLLKSLIPKATGPVKERYSTCSEHFDDAIGDFDDSLQDLKISDPASLNIHVSAAMTEVDDCEDELKGLAADPAVVKGSQDLGFICDIILVLSNLIPR